MLAAFYCMRGKVNKLHMALCIEPYAAFLYFIISIKSEYESEYLWYLL